jgi:hypothetical protein
MHAYGRIRAEGFWVRNSTRCLSISLVALLFSPVVQAKQALSKERHDFCQMALPLNLSMSPSYKNEILKRSVAEFEIKRDTIGRVIDIHVLKSSGSTTADQVISNQIKLRLKFKYSSKQCDGSMAYKRVMILPDD